MALDLVLPIFLPDKPRRTDYSRCNLQARPAERGISDRAYRGFDVQGSADGRGIFHRLRGDHFRADCLSAGRRPRSGCTGYTLFLPDEDLFGDITFSQGVVPIGQVPSGGRADTGSASPSPASMAAVMALTKSGAASETTGGRFGLVASTCCSGTPPATRGPGPAPASCVRPVPDLCCCSFCAIAPCSSASAITRQDLRQMENAICITVLMRAPRLHSRAILAALTIIKPRFF